jgi:hypothetical protein
MEVQQKTKDDMDS